MQWSWLIFVVAFPIATAFSMYTRGKMNSQNVASYGPEADYRHNLGGAIIGSAITGAIYAAIITAVINKFDAACNKRDLRLNDPNIFVLVDEAHRTNYGSLHAHMRRVCCLISACWI